MARMGRGGADSSLVLAAGNIMRFSFSDLDL